MPDTQPTNQYELSLIVPVYNAEPYLSRCIESLLNVDVNKEIILIDDGSTDNSLAVLNQYAQQYSGIRVISQPNKGVSAVRNRGIELAQGRYLQFVDSDDYLIFSHFSSLIHAADSYNLDIIQWLMIEQDLNNPNLEKRYRYTLPLDLPNGKRKAGSTYSGESYVLEMVKQNQVFSCCTGLYRTDYLRTHQIHFDESITSCEDSLFLLDAMLKGPSPLVLDFPHYIYCYNRNSNSCTKQKNNLIAFQHIFHACEAFSQREQHFAEQSPTKSEILSNMKLRTYLYAYQQFYQNFDDQTKQVARHCFTPHILSQLQSIGATIKL